jgi:hypothetical protein
LIFSVCPTPPRRAASRSSILIGPDVLSRGSRGLAS